MVEPAAAANFAQCASAPASPPSFAPSPPPTDVTKNVIGAGACFGAWASKPAAVKQNNKVFIPISWYNNSNAPKEPTKLHTLPSHKRLKPVSVTSFFSVKRKYDHKT
jgi:hypothetical protein